MRLSEEKVVKFIMINVGLLDGGLHGTGKVFQFGIMIIYLLPLALFPTKFTVQEKAVPS